MPVRESLSVLSVCLSANCTLWIPLPLHSSESSSDESEGGQREGEEEGSPRAPAVSPLHSPSSVTEGEGLVANGKGESREHTMEGIFGDAADISSS